MSTPFDPGDRVAAYLRDSGGDMQDLSTSQQEAEIRRWCQENNLILTEIFTDEAAPGSSVVSRAGFLRMIAHFSGEKRVQEAGVLIWKFSRFARDINDAQFYKADLRRRGYIIHSINENIPDGLNGRLFEAAVDWMNARYLQDLSEDVKRGLHHNLRQHGAIGGTPPRGFRRSAPIELGTRRNGQPHIVHRWEPDPELVPLVRQAFAMRANGASYEAITKETGGLLYRHKNSWKHFFENKIYIGIMEYGGHVIENYCEPVVSRETWQMVQENNQKNKLVVNMDPKNHPRAKASDYILTGLLRCAQCGSPMVGSTIYNRKKDHTNRYYKCTRKRGECSARQVPKEFLELTVLNEITEHVVNLENLLNLRDEIESSADSKVAETRERLDTLLRSRTNIHVQIDRLTDALAEMGTSPAVVSKIKIKERQEMELLAQIETAETELTRLTNLPSDKQIQDLAEKVGPLLRASDRTTLRRWLRELVDHIDVERINKKLVGTIFYFMPNEFMPTQVSHRSAYVYKHDFSTDIQTRRSLRLRRRPEPCRI